VIVLFFIELIDQLVTTIKILANVPPVVFCKGEFTARVYAFISSSIQNLIVKYKNVLTFIQSLSFDFFNCPGFSALVKFKFNL